MEFAFHVEVHVKLAEEKSLGAKNVDRINQLSISLGLLATKIVLLELFKMMRR